jgi:hypothetical protein
VTPYFFSIGRLFFVDGSIWFLGQVDQGSATALYSLDASSGELRTGPFVQQERIEVVTGGLFEGNPVNRSPVNFTMPAGMNPRASTTRQKTAK